MCWKNKSYSLILLNNNKMFAQQQYGSVVELNFTVFSLNWAEIISKLGCFTAKPLLQSSEILGHNIPRCKPLISYIISSYVWLGLALTETGTNISCMYYKNKCSFFISVKMTKELSFWSTFSHMQTEMTLPRLLEAYTSTPLGPGLLLRTVENEFLK